MDNEIRKLLECSLLYEVEAYFLYIAYAEKAEEDGFSNVAKLFRAIAYAEKVHANMIYLVYKKKLITDEDLETLKAEINIDVKDTIKNLEHSIQLEDKLSGGLYDEYAQKAIQLGNSALFIVLKQLARSGESHKKLFKRALDSIKTGQDLSVEEGIFVCPVCGYVVIDNVPFKCPVCDEGGRNFKKF